MKKNILSFLLLVLHIHLFAQFSQTSPPYRVFIELKAGLHREFNKLTDPGNQLITRAPIEPTTGINAGVYLNDGRTVIGFDYDILTIGNSLPFRTAPSSYGAGRGFQRLTPNFQYHVPIIHNKERPLLSLVGKVGPSINFNGGPKFYGMADVGQDPEPTASTSGMGGRAVNSARNNAANTAAAVLGEEGAGLIANLFNKKIWNALGREQELRKGFYNATNMVDAYRSSNLIGDKSLLNALGRTGLINFLTDGSLNTSFADGLKDRFVRRNIYSNALKVAYTGLQMMQQQGIEIRAETKSAVQGTLQKYKANGGGTEYDNINQFTTPKK